MERKNSIIKSKSIFGQIVPIHKDDDWFYEKQKEKIFEDLHQILDAPHGTFNSTQKQFMIDKILGSWGALCSGMMQPGVSEGGSKYEYPKLPEGERLFP